MSELLNRFVEQIKKQGLFGKKDSLLIAVSGGVDSVVLCELCRQADHTFAIAHCNFQLRGEESERDEAFVKQLAEHYGVKLFLQKFDTENFSKDHKLSIQEAARKLRYDWFNELLSGFDYLLTAHHADDNVETLLMNFFRGTGLSGLTGIPAKTGKIRRPLLSFRKEELLAFALENKLEFVEDSSNASSKYTRNYFRNELIPQLEKVYPQVNQNLLDNIDRFSQIENLYQSAVSMLKNKLCKTKGKEIHVPVKQLLHHNNRALVYEIIHPFGFSEKQIDEVIKLATAANGSYINAPQGGFRIIRNRHWLIITPVAGEEVENFIIEKPGTDIDFSLGTLRASNISERVSSLDQSSTSNFIATLDAKQIRFPLLLRKWKTGDYFYPLGMQKKKKLSRFFIDQKLSKPEKENAWVIESDKKIIWVVGKRIDERFKISAKTKEVLSLELLPAQ
jgi:tRNA(Ile)-lysidine synthase